MSMNKTALALTTALSLLAFAPAHADEVTGVDPACMMRNADGTDSVDMTKCPDGKTLVKTDSTATPQPDATSDVTAQTATGTVIVPADMMTGATIMSASDYIGKRVYDNAGNDIGEVNDLIMSNDGKIQATILGVGGFLGIGEKDVAVAVSSVEMVKDGDDVKLVVNATKEQLEKAPTFDPKIRNYAS